MENFNAGGRSFSGGSQPYRRASFGCLLLRFARSANPEGKGGNRLQAPENKAQRKKGLQPRASRSTQPNVLCNTHPPLTPPGVFVQPSQSPDSEETYVLYFLYLWTYKGSGRSTAPAASPRPATTRAAPQRTPPEAREPARAKIISPARAFPFNAPQTAPGPKLLQRICSNRTPSASFALHSPRRSVSLRFGDIRALGVFNGVAHRF
jgi:hypothetical protein